jgi:(p)ppGpp synthase/HD superfamily hydrolase
MKISLTYWLLGKGYYNAYNAMIFAEKLHNGLRKDGEHEFSHQISQALLARTLIGDVMYKEELFMVIFLHDVCEDKGISYEEIEKLFGVLVMNSVKLMTKVYQGVKTQMSIMLR